MKINEVEALVGITKKNIRFYEAEGLLTPRRNSENGYRDYGDADVAVLRRIKLLRKLGVPLEEIRQMQSGAHTVGDGMRRHLVTLEREQENLAAAARLCAGLTECREKLETLDAQALLEQMDEMEQRVRDLKEKEDFDAIRPDLNGDEIMQLLGIEPGPLVGKAYKHMLEYRLDNGPVERDVAVAELNRWYEEQQAE